MSIGTTLHLNNHLVPKVIKQNTLMCNKLVVLKFSNFETLTIVNIEDARTSDEQALMWNYIDESNIFH
jgi:hypothetical protein